MALSEKRIALGEKGLGASEVPVALGLVPWMSAAELRAIKRHEMPPFSGNTFTHWGQTLERTIVDEWLRVHRDQGEDVSIFTPPTIQHPTCPVLFASADRVVVPEGRRAREAWQGCLEGKNVSAYRKAEFGEADDAVPEAVLVQQQVQLEVLGLEKGWVVALIGGNVWREYPQKRDLEMGGQIVAFVEKWYADHVVQGLPVEVDGSEASFSYLRRRHPKETAPLLPATPELYQLVEALRLARAMLKDSEVAESERANALRAAIGEAAGVENLCSYRANKDSTKTDWESVANYLAVGHPDLLAAAVARYTITKPGARQLRLANAKG